MASCRTIRHEKQSLRQTRPNGKVQQMGLRTRRQGAARAASFMRRGIAFAMASGACYGLYTTFLTLAQTQGAWPQWLAGLPWGAAGVLPSGNTAVALPPAGGVHPGLSPITAAFAMAALAAGLNDLLSGVWSLAMCAKNQQLGDLVRMVRSRPGAVMMLSATIGGPFAATCYVVALNAATRAGNPGVIVPIAALNVTVGAILGRVMFGQRLSANTAAGIAACLGAGAVIGGASLSSMGAGAAMGCAFALLAAIGWGFEGCVAGFGTALIDYRIGIAIRQLTAGILEAAVLFPPWRRSGATQRACLPFPQRPLPAPPCRYSPCPVCSPCRRTRFGTRAIQCAARHWAWPATACTRSGRRCSCGCSWALPA